MVTQLIETAESPVRLKRLPDTGEHSHKIRSDVSS